MSNTALRPLREEKGSEVRFSNASILLLEKMDGKLRWRQLKEESSTCESIDERVLIVSLDVIRTESPLPLTFKRTCLNYKPVIKN